MFVVHKDLYDYLDILCQFLSVMTGRRIALPRRGRYQRRWALPVLRVPVCALRLPAGARVWLADALIDVALIGGGTVAFVIMWLFLFS